MKPERAREIADEWTCPLIAGENGYLYSKIVEMAILQACAEQKEIDAKIALSSASSAGYDIAQIIRRQD